jgi:UDP-N-acetylmuramoyl-L-alanyl-D-glutamate--2,6-diaminopimelate ligase
MSTVEIVEPTEAEALALEQDAMRRGPVAAAQIQRPTRAPFPWAEPFTTVGVTGTNGKTSTTQLVAAAMAGPTRPVLCETTIGYSFKGAPVNVPRTLRGFLGALARAAQLGGKHAAVETTSQALNRGYARMWRFDVGVFTNLSHDHLSQHGSWEHYLASKAQLFVHLGPGATAVLNAADPCAELLDRVTPSDVKRLWYGVPSRGEYGSAPDLAAHSVQVTLEGTRVELTDTPLAAAFAGALTTRLLGDVFAENLLAAAAAAYAVGIPAEEIAANLAACPTPLGRFELVSKRPLVAIDYAHTPDALLRTCRTARQLAGKGRLIVVFGAGGGRDSDKREPMGRAVGQFADYAVITNDNPRNEPPEAIAAALARGCRKGGRAHTLTRLDRREAILHAVRLAQPGDLVLVAGKGHERDQEIAEQRVSFSDAEIIKEAIGG